MDQFVSYAQNFEDVMLWRALRHVDHGFYIDAGAADPELDSVTCAFYQRGWSGMNIEPALAPFTKLAAARPRDINLNVAVGAAGGEAELLLVDGGDGLSTLCLERREALLSEGRRVEPQRVAVKRLGDLCREHGVKDIHFLKIDVEGYEAGVIEGAELGTWRPWIVVVEATEPNTMINSYGGWETLILGAGYDLAYCDGLNRFYLAQEHHDLAPAFASPPNVFDRFLRREEWLAKHNADTLYKQVLELGEHEAQLVRRLGHVAAERDTSLQELWESNRLVGVLSGQRQSLADELFAANEEHRRLVAKIDQVWEVPQRAVETVVSGDAPEVALEERQYLVERVALVITERQALLEKLAVVAEQHRLSEESARQQIAAIYGSTSWRFSAPLRVLKRFRAAP